MKKYLLISFTTIFLTNYSVAAIDTSECDKITGKLKMGEKIDCLLAIKKANLKKPKMLTDINNQLNSLEEKKKNFDEKNPTLMKMFKNMRKSDK